MLTPLLGLLSPLDGGLKHCARPESLQKLSPCSCRRDSAAQTLLPSDLSLVI